MKDDRYRLLGLYLFTVIALLLWMCSCTTTKYVPVETVRTEYKSKMDTVIQKDTVKTEKVTVIREANDNDSIMLAQMGIKLKSNERLLILLQNQLNEAKSHYLNIKTDTVIEKDTIQVPYPVEKELTVIQKIKLNIFWILIAGCFVLFIALLNKKKR